MKIKFKHTINYAEIDQLIERYYDGLTTADEEKRLLQFLSQPGLPPQYEPEKAILGYFNNKKTTRTEKERYSIPLYMRWSAVAAVALAVMLSIPVFRTVEQRSFAYVDGQRITEPGEIKSQAISSLNALSSGKSLVDDGLENVSTRGIIQEQLDAFSAFE